MIENNLLVGRAVKNRERVNFAINLSNKEIFEDKSFINLYPPYFGKLNNFFISPIEYAGDNDDILLYQFPDSVNKAVIDGEIVILKFRQN